ncbi:MAG: hypothetical protein ABSH13_13075 [Candidatus Acidiferrum sp.]|jgi:hypothetical protein
MISDKKCVVRASSLLLAFVASLVVPSVALAQNCALCYTQAAGAGARIAQALRSGIVILVLPPMLICVGLAVMTYRKRNTFNEE